MEPKWIATSLEAARMANRKHSRVLREIERLKNLLPGDVSRDFHYVKCIACDGVPHRFYHLSSFGLAMLDVGQGRSALRWKGERLKTGE